MRILDKYIVKEIFGTFLFGIFAFTSVFIGGGTLYRIAHYMTDYGASFSAVVRMFVLSLPSIIVLTFPMSMLLATLLSFGRLSGSSEIIAMKSGGISFYRIAAPAFVIAFAVSLFSIGFNELIVPRANEAYDHLVEYEIKGNTAPKSQEHIVIKDIKGGAIERLIYARRYDADTNAMYGISVQEFDNDVMVRVQNAEKAEWQSGSWVMYNGVLNDLAGEEGVQRTLRFEKQVLPVRQSPKQILQQQKKPDQMTVRELRQEIRLLQSQYVNTKKLENELYQRFTIPFASFIFALIGAPLGLQPNRQSSSIGFGISIIIIFIYYACMTTFSAFGQSGILPPLLAAWMPNIAGVAIGGYLIRNAAR